MAVNTFCGSLENAHMQRDLLAVPTPTLEAAVRARNEHLQILPNMVPNQAQIPRSGVGAVQPEKVY